MTGRANADATDRRRRVGLALPTILASLLCGGSVLALSVSGAAELGGLRGQTDRHPDGRVLGLAALQPPSAVSARLRPTPTDESTPTLLAPATPAGPGGPNDGATGDGATGDPAPARTAAPAVQILFTRGPISGRYTPPPVPHPHRPPVAPVPAPSPTGPGSAPAPVPAPPTDPGPVAEQPLPDQAPAVGPLDADGDHDGSVVVAGDRARPVCADQAATTDPGPEPDPDADPSHDVGAAVPTSVD